MPLLEISSLSGVPGIYFQPLLCGCDERKSGRLLEQILSSVHKHSAKTKIKRTCFAQGIVLLKSALCIILFFLILVFVFINLL